MNSRYNAARQTAWETANIAQLRARPMPKPDKLADYHVVTRHGERAHVYVDRWGGAVRVAVSIQDHAAHLSYDPHTCSPTIRAEGERLARELGAAYGEVSRVVLLRYSWQAIIDHPAANAP